ncbi:uncharacterized protein [Tenebrio molitor]|uniref:uncharacterized protein isoform X1 n=1 Tax=Tenebrio molitor TaxID=7067 RepID=UPI00362470BA
MDTIAVDLNELLFVPLKTAFVHVVFSFTSNVVFSSLAQGAVPSAFISYAIYFGVCRTYLIASIEMFFFTLITIILFTAFFCFAMILKQLFAWGCQNTIKMCTLFYVICCFRMYNNVRTEDVEKFIITLVVMSTKLLCATEYLEKTLRYKTLKLFTVMAYLAHPSWVSFKDFLRVPVQEDNQHNAEWWYRVVSAGPKSAIYKVVSHTLVEYNTFLDVWLKPTIFPMVLSFQYISRYYFWAQIAELELLALGVKDFSVFNLMFAELSLLPKDFILNLNKPLTEFLHKKFIVQYKYWNGVTGIIHGAVIFSLMISYNLKYSMLIFLFVGSMWVQERALFLFERTHKICVYSCPTPYCFHFFPYTSKRTQLIDCLIPLLWSAFNCIACAYVTNVLFCKFAFFSDPERFNVCAGFFGICLLIFVEPKYVFRFTFLTICFFTLFLFIAIKSKQWFGLGYQNVLKILILLHAVYCFEAYRELEEIDEIIVTFIVLSLKLLCATENLEKSEDSNKLQICNTIAYLAYPPWLSFKDFLSLRTVSHGSHGWFTILHDMAPIAVFFKILSYYTIGNSVKRKLIIFQLLRAFQYRCRYYFRAQIGAIELAAVGLLQPNWKYYPLFNFHFVEFSVTAREAMANLNLPLSLYINERFGGSLKRNILGWLHVIPITLVLYLYSPWYALIALYFLASTMLQRAAITSLEEYFQVCFHTSLPPECCHRNRPVDGELFFVKCWLVFYNHLRIGLLFIRSETPAIFAFVISAIIVTSMIDVIIIAYCLLKMIRQTRL